THELLNRVCRSYPQAVGAVSLAVPILPLRSAFARSDSVPGLRHGDAQHSSKGTLGPSSNPVRRSSSKPESSWYSGPISRCSPASAESTLDGGRTTVAVVPRPFSLCSVSEPPWSSPPLRATGGPRPAPSP